MVLTSIQIFWRQISDSGSRRRPTVVCISGSTRFTEELREANLRESLAGRIVLSVGVVIRSDDDLLATGELTMEDKVRLDEPHLRKIDMCDELLVLNVGGYYGDSTRAEIIYAAKMEIPIRWLEPDKARMP